MMGKRIVLICLAVVLASCNTSVLDSTGTSIPSETSTATLPATLVPTVTPPSITETPSKVPEFRYSGINKISVSPNGANLVVADLDGVWIYDLSNGELILFQEGDPIIDIPAFSIADILWSPDGDCVAVTQDKNGVWVWDTTTWELLTEIKGESPWPDAKGNPGFTWSPDGTKLALGTGGGNVSVWNKNTNEWENLEKEIEVEGLQLGILWTRDNRLTTVMGSKLYDVEKGEYLSDIRTAIDGIGRITWSPNQTHLYFLFDMGGGYVDIGKEYHWWCCNVFSWSNAGEYFATFYYDDNTIFVVDTSTNERIFTQQQSNRIFALAWTPNAELLAVGFKEEQLVLFNVYADEIVMELGRHVIKW